MAARVANSAIPGCARRLARDNPCQGPNNGHAVFWSARDAALDERGKHRHSKDANDGPSRGAENDTVTGKHQPEGDETRRRKPTGINRHGCLSEPAIRHRAPEHGDKCGNEHEPDLYRCKNRALLCDADPARAKAETDKQGPAHRLPGRVAIAFDQTNQRMDQHPCIDQTPNRKSPPCGLDRCVDLGDRELVRGEPVEATCQKGRDRESKPRGQHQNGGQPGAVAIKAHVKCPSGLRVVLPPK